MSPARVAIGILIILLILAEHGNLRQSEMVEQVCALTAPHDIYDANPSSARQQLDNICISHRPD